MSFKCQYFLQNQDQPENHYCLSMSWFRIWEGFVMNREREPPGPIDNKAIVITTGNSVGGSNRGVNQTLRNNADYIRLSRDIWLLFHSIYGGGPEVIMRPNGSVQVNATANKPSLPAHNTRVRARSTSESSAAAAAAAAGVAGGRVTRSKSKSESVNHQQQVDGGTVSVSED